MSRLTLCNPGDCSTPGSPVLQSLSVCSKFMSIELVLPSIQLILCCSVLLLLSIFPSTRVFSNKWTPHIRWPKYWNFSIGASIDTQGWFPLGLTVWSPCCPRDSQGSSPEPQPESINSSALSLFTVQLSHPYMTTGKPQLWLDRLFSAKWCLCFSICCLGLS